MVIEKTLNGEISVFIDKSDDVDIYDSVNSAPNKHEGQIIMDICTAIEMAKKILNVAVIKYEE